jgi:hypothetical protein
MAGLEGIPPGRIVSPIIERCWRSGSPRRQGQHPYLLVIHAMPMSLRKGNRDA